MSHPVHDLEIRIQHAPYRRFITVRPNLVIGAVAPPLSLKAIFETRQIIEVKTIALEFFSSSWPVVSMYMIDVRLRLERRLGL